MINFTAQLEAGTSHTVISWNPCVQAQEHEQRRIAFQHSKGHRIEAFYTQITAGNVGIGNLCYPKHAQVTAALL